MNAFMLWSKDQRKIIAMNNPKMHHSEISKYLGRLWSTLPQAQKQPFVDEYKRNRIQHKNMSLVYLYRPRKRPLKKTMKIDRRTVGIDVGIQCNMGMDSPLVQAEDQSFQTDSVFQTLLEELINGQS